MLSMQMYQDLYVCFPVYENVMQGFLAMAMRSGAISGLEARGLIESLRERGTHHKASEQAVGSFTIDFNLAMTDPDKAKVHILALQFDELAIFDQFTSGEYVNQEFKATREEEERTTITS